MLSILIPVYNCNVSPLVREIYKQVAACDILFEIVVYDDGSNLFTEKNKLINSFSDCNYKELPKNIGRSAIRNLLAKEARYTSLLFIDAGTFPESTNFIKKYLKNITYPVVTGGMTCLKEAPEKPFRLRWMYTKKRESLVPEGHNKRPIVCSSNFLIQKEVFNATRFDESLTQYGCEDVVFFDSISKKGIPIQYIKNPVIHDASDDSKTFIQKTEFAIENLIHLINSNKLSKDRYQVSHIYDTLHTIKLDAAVSFIFIRCRNLLKKNLYSSYPSIICYDFYRLGYFCFIKNQQ